MCIIYSVGHRLGTFLHYGELCDALCGAFDMWWTTWCISHYMVHLALCGAFILTLYRACALVRNVVLHWHNVTWVTTKSIMHYIMWDFFALFTSHIVCPRSPFIPPDTGVPGEPVPIDCEEDIFAIIDFPYKTPEERNYWYVESSHDTITALLCIVTSSSLVFCVVWFHFAFGRFLYNVMLPSKF